LDRLATVVLVDGRLMAEIVRTEACQQCRACQFGQTERILLPLPKGKYRAGDTVSVSLPESKFTQASIIAYALPVLFMFAGLLIPNLLGFGEGVQAIGAICMLAAGLGLVKLLDRKIRHSDFEPQIRVCDKR